jgi:hypothetical protein
MLVISVDHHHINVILVEDGTIKYYGVSFGIFFWIFIDHARSARRKFSLADPNVLSRRDK